MQANENFLKHLAKGISSLFGPNCEVTVHDLTKGFENSIVAIENGNVTGRKIGDGASEMVLEALKGNPSPKEKQYYYLARTKEGRMIKSTSVYVRDDNDKIIGLFGLNYDVTDLMMAQHALDVATHMNDADDGDSIGTITTNVTDLLDQIITEADKFVGKPLAMMTKEDKTKAIQFLNNKGAFLVTKAGDKISKHYDISKYTLYNYMDADT